MSFPKMKRSERRPLSLTRSFFNFVKLDFSFDSKRRSSSKTETKPKMRLPSEFMSKPMSKSPPPRSRKSSEISRPYPIHHSSRKAQISRRISALPPELLAHIFVLGSEDDSMFPVTVSHVCSSWRWLTLSTPSLWRRVCLDDRTDMWKERIRRAKACSLDIQLSSRIYRDVESGRLVRHQVLDFYNVHWYMHVANPWIHRWRTLEIVFHDYAPWLWNAALAECCSKYPYLSAPALEELVLFHPHNDDTKEFLLFGGRAPRLRRVALNGIRLLWLPSLFGNITVLDYTHHGFTVGSTAVIEILSMLGVSNRLSELRITFPSRMRPVPVSSTNLYPVSLPYLSRLILRVQTADIPVELLLVSTHLTVPSLRSLHLLDDTRALSSFPGLHAFLRTFRKPERLASLRVEGGWYDFRLMRKWVGRLSGLARFVVKDGLGRERVLVGGVRPRTASGPAYRREG
ncbi:hypothetical protein NEOLEDRAFT_1130886 [Neolentinus lepideus HHB14362 ss-1]|uniref:F-box domain-containing protein n=1 Tax=Neolentinus lepideus HHB14362 ss-1 TaxID=1314782 RepID=A0A165TY90_9AGAM|nr:hypothetical protein NEOLEDRAFT_1130886 [Neolentinus lepideus HHB14362 ss-1]